MEKLKEQIQSIVDIYKSGNLLEAEFLTGQLINNNPKVVFLYNLLGLILAEQKKDDQAMKCYEKGIDIDDFLDKTTIFDEFEDLIPDEEFSILIITIFNIPY